MHDGHDHHVGRRRVVADQLLEGFVGHFHLVRAAAVDEAHQLAIAFQHQKTGRVLRNAQRDFFGGGGFVTFVGADFDGVTAGGVARLGQTQCQLRGVWRHGAQSSNWR